MLRAGRLMEKAVQLLLIECAENGYDQIPGHGYLCTKSVMDINLKAFPVGKVIRLIAGQQLHGFRSTGIGVRHALGDLQIVLARLNVTHDGRFILQFQQTSAAHQGLPEIGVYVRQICGDEPREPRVARVLQKRPRKGIFTHGFINGKVMGWVVQQYPGFLDL